MNYHDHLKQQLQKQEKLAALGMMCAGIAHEIQNPLNFVINFSKMSNSLLNDLNEVLKPYCDGMTDDDRLDMEDILHSLKQNLTLIAENGERATSIIQGILLLSRGKEDEYVLTDVRKIVKEYVWLSYHAMRANHAGFNVSIHENYDESVPMSMVVPQDISRAVLNIMNNACYAVWKKSQETTEFSPVIDVNVSANDGNISVCITDNGVGMDDEVKQHLFDDFFTTKPIGEGTGLGMGITRYIIEEKHGGTLSFSTAEGQGSSFTIFIPVKQ